MNPRRGHSSSSACLSGALFASCERRMRIHNRVLHADIASVEVPHHATVTHVEKAASFRDLADDCGSRLGSRSRLQIDGHHARTRHRRRRQFASSARLAHSQSVTLAVEPGKCAASSLAHALSNRPTAALCPRQSRSPLTRDGGGSRPDARAIVASAAGEPEQKRPRKRRRDRSPLRTRRHPRIGGACPYRLRLPTLGSPTTRTRRCPSVLRLLAVVPSQRIAQCAGASSAASASAANTLPSA